MRARRRPEAIARRTAMNKKLPVALPILWLVIEPRASATTATAAQEGPPSPTVNVDFILDTSGSMAELTDTGETRMEAAKRVLREVIDAIPDREGVNVGLRLYGYKGDNSDATKDISCKSTRSFVKVSGIDREKLHRAIDGAQPTGWTPIALSLQRAEKDFPKTEGEAVNAVVLLTDGAETCDGDPCKIA